ncbi:hypothetical protein F4818DRAFT_443695 [Hypoxylon cercidicola]|nr:hypothetical protein F4818DRAFT_443695 [Hypoxylon cercidicola]
MTTVYPAVTNNGAVTSFVPLATVFTPSAGCSEYFRLNGPSLVAFDPGYGLDIDTDVRCLPSAVTTWWEQGRLGGDGEDHTAISLGPLVCPDEWQTVASSVEMSSTLAMCCPSSLVYGDNKSDTKLYSGRDCHRGMEYQIDDTNKNRDYIELPYSPVYPRLYIRIYFFVFVVAKPFTAVKPFVVKSFVVLEQPISD